MDILEGWLIWEIVSYDFQSWNYILYLHFGNANIWVKSILKGTAFQFEKLHFMY